MKKIINLTILLLISSSVFTQSFKEKYADKLYANLEYFECSQIYSEMADNSINNKKSNYPIILKAALSLYNLKNYEKASPYFYLLELNNQLNPSQLLMYFDCLTSLKKYDVIKTTLSFKSINSDYYSLKNLKKYQDSLSQDSSRFIIEKLAINSGKGDYSASVYEDNLYYASNKENNEYIVEKYKWNNLNFSDIYTSDQTLLKSTYMPNLSEEYHDGPIAFLNNDVYITRTKFIKDKGKTVKHVGVYYGTKNGILLPLKFNSTSYNVGHVVFNKKGDIMYFTSDSPYGIGGSDIYYSNLINGEWGEPINLGVKINTIGDEMFPFIDSEDGLYFSSNGRSGFGGLDVYYLQKGGSNCVNVGSPINSVNDDFSFILNEDLKSGFMSSDRDLNVDNLYSFKIGVISGFIKLNAISTKGELLKDPEFYLINKETKIKSKVVKNASGEYLFPVERNSKYVVIGSKKNFVQNDQKEIIIDHIMNNEVVEAEIVLNQISIDLTIKVVNSLNNAPLPNVDGSILTLNGQTLKISTNDLGEGIVNVPLNQKFVLSGAKKGYLDINKPFNTMNNDSVLVFNMIEITEGLVFKVENILYDLGKWDLREPSKKELDKLCNFLLLNSNVKIELSSHTDSRSTAEFNLILSQKRAQSCYDYLILKGVDKKNITVKGYGETKPLNKCIDGSKCSEEEYQLNRRTEVKILSIN